MSVGWPPGYEPSVSDLHVKNLTTSATEPPAIWDWLVRPDLWSSFYRNAWRTRPDAGSWPALSLGSRRHWITFGASVVTTVTEFEPPHRLAWTGIGLAAAGRHKWLLQPLGTVTRITTEQTQRGPVVRLLGPVLRPAMRMAHQSWVTGLAQVSPQRKPI